TFLVLSLCDSAGAQTECPISSPDGMFGTQSCVVTIDRDNPVPPPPITVHSRTTVTIHLINAHPNEYISFVETKTRTPPTDVATAGLKALLNPSILPNAVLHSDVISTPAYMAEKQVQEFFSSDDPLADELNAMIDTLNAAQASIGDALTRLSCLQAYKTITGTAGGLHCSPVSLSSATFTTAKGQTVTGMLQAAKAVLPIASQQFVDGQIKDAITKAPSIDDATSRQKALELQDRYASTNTLIGNVIQDAQKTQASLLESADKLATLANYPEEATFDTTSNRGYTSTSVVINAQDVISQTAAQITTVAVTWQSNAWEISTGVMFSALPQSTFSNAPLVTNGQPQLDANGKNLTYVQQTNARPGVLFPIVMASWRVGFLSNFAWENRCPNHCAFLVTGGIGLNLKTTTAEFAIGPSFQFGGILLTPALHLGRSPHLTQGLYPNIQLGSSPPDPLPTETRWIGKFGIAATYVVPFS
ncbi:MAG TPA: hypothetical protein VNZ26_33535, partial [Vicinamibacterales bacterium]|nr:hypothetical protein [Vicinamibacterales bacterium]